jgi:hypothetical protein
MPFCRDFSSNDSENIGGRKVIFQMLKNVIQIID